MADFKLDTDGPVAKPFHDPYRILALSGGGYRGLFTAALLVELEATGGPLTQRFDLIVGTSIGSILAGAIALGASAADCLQGMLDHGERIFPPGGRVKDVARRVQQAVGGQGAVHRGAAGGGNRRHRGQAEDLMLSDMDAALAIPCVSHTRAATRVPRSRGLAGAAGSKVTLLEAMLASAAAPTYFPSRTLLSEDVVDGGLVANAPEMIGLTDAVDYHQADLGRIRVLSIGTASTPHPRAVHRHGIDAASACCPSARHRRRIRVLFIGTASTPHPRAVHRHGIDAASACCPSARHRRRIRVLFIGTASTPHPRAVHRHGIDVAGARRRATAASAAVWMTTRELLQVTMQAQESLAISQCRALLGRRYMRIDRSPSPRQAAAIELDRADPVAVATLVDLARECWADASADPDSGLRQFQPN